MQWLGTRQVCVALVANDEPLRSVTLREMRLHSVTVAVSALGSSLMCPAGDRWTLTTFFGDPRAAPTTRATWSLFAGHITTGCMATRARRTI